MATAMDVDSGASSSSGTVKGDKKRFEVKKVGVFILLYPMEND